MQVARGIGTCTMHCLSTHPHQSLLLTVHPLSLSATEFLKLSLIFLIQSHAGQLHGRQQPPPRWPRCRIEKRRALCDIETMFDKPRNYWFSHPRSQGDVQAEAAQQWSHHSLLLPAFRPPTGGRMGEAYGGWAYVRRVSCSLSLGVDGTSCIVVGFQEFQVAALRCLCRRTRLDSTVPGWAGPN